MSGDRSQECPHVRMTVMMITMLTFITFLVLSVQADPETGDPPSQSTAMYNKILSSMDISREVRKVFTSLWATPEVKVRLDHDLCVRMMMTVIHSRPLLAAAPVSGAGCWSWAWSTSPWSTSRGTLSRRT